MDFVQGYRIDKPSPLSAKLAMHLPAIRAAAERETTAMATVLRDRVGQETVLTPGAEGGPEALSKLIAEALEDCLKAHETRLTVNLERINTISGEVLEVSLIVRKRSRGGGGGLVLTSANAVRVMPSSRPD